MRTLLIDNFDSFTFNLCNLVAEINGAPPTVVRNDVDPRSLDFKQFDSIIISPGPGRPDREADFGVCAYAIQESHLPVLGVCLGHQGICHVFGGVVDYAPVPVHGKIDLIHHRNDDLFAGIPTPFEAVRYHSLVATRLPESLEEIAWTSDGLLMGLRHRHRRIWGVQFHPESICTAFGRELIENFLRLAGRNTREVHPSTSEPSATASGVPVPETPPRQEAGGEKELELLFRQLGVLPSASELFDTLYASSESSFWLDGSATQDGRSRFSFLGDASGPNAEVIRYCVRERQVEIKKKGQPLQLIDSGFFDFLKESLNRRKVLVPIGLPFLFNLGYIGYLGYELKAETGGSVVHESEFPDASVIFADRMIALDHVERQCYLLCLVRRGENEAGMAWMDDMGVRLACLPPEEASRTPSSKVFGASSLLQQVRFRHERADYLKLIGACLEEIRNGESYEICLTNAATLDDCPDLDPRHLFETLRAISPVPYAAYVKLEDMAVLSASPERFLSVDCHGVVESKPIKGTRPRGRTVEEDTRLREQLASSEKDRAENLMIVDLVRNDLNTVCETGSVNVPSIFSVETYAPVHQLVSTIRGKLRADVSTVDCVRAAFPGGSMTGAPKLRTMEIIDKLEGKARGVYSGALGWFGLGGGCELSIVIRTMTMSAERIHFGVGGAIIALSDPSEEFDEILIKSRAMIAAVFQAKASKECPA